MMVKLTQAIATDLRNTMQYLQEPYSRIGDDFDLYFSMLSWLDKLYSSDLKKLLSDWRPKVWEAKRELRRKFRP